LDAQHRHDPAETLRALYRCFELRDLGRLGRLLADEVVCGEPGATGERRVSRQQILAYLAGSIAASDGTVTARPIAILGWSGQRAIAVHDERRWRQGTLRSRWAGLLVEVEGGSIRRMDHVVPATVW
jgi:hypothetical protein